MAKENISEKSKNNLAKRGKKGGTRYPNNSLKHMLPFLKELISKTHTKGINIEQLNAGVFQLRPKSVDGGVKYSSLKQYGLASGEYSSIIASELASLIELSTEGDKLRYIRQAFFNVQTFKNLFDTYQSSTTSKSKIKSYVVSSLKVHPDLADKFLKSFIESAEIAEICTINGEDISFKQASNIEIGPIKVENGEDFEEDGIGEQNNPEEQENDYNSEDDSTSNVKPKLPKIRSTSPNIDLKIDPTLDPDKLEKQLKILRKFGLI